MQPCSIQCGSKGILSAGRYTFISLYSWSHCELTHIVHMVQILSVAISFSVRNQATSCTNQHCNSRDCLTSHCQCLLAAAERGQVCMSKSKGQVSGGIAAELPATLPSVPVCLFGFQSGISEDIVADFMSQLLV